MLPIFNTDSYFLIIHKNKLDKTFKSHLFNEFLIFLVLLSATKPGTIFQSSLKLTLQLS